MLAKMSSIIFLFCFFFCFLNFFEVVFSAFSYLILLILFMFNRNMLINNFWMWDSLTFIMFILSASICLFCFLAEKKQTKLSILMSFLIIFLFFLSNKMLNLFILFEMSLIPVFFLVIGWGKQPERMKASKFMILYTLLTSFPLLFFIFSVTDFFNYDSIFMMTSKVEDLNSEFSSIFYLLAISMAFFIKTPLFLCHSWLPKAHVEATVTGSMILAGIMLKMGVYGLIRFLPFFFEAQLFSSAIFSISLTGSVISSWLSLSSDDMKMTVAYASVSHMNFCLCSLFSLKVFSLKACILVLVTHGFCSSGLFFLVTKCYTMSGSRSMSVSKGILSMFPSMVLISFLFWVLNLAAPPSLSFSSEVWSLLAICSFMPWSLMILMMFIILNSFFSVFNFGLSSISSFSISLKGTSKEDFFLTSFFFLFPLFFLFFFPDLLI